MMNETDALTDNQKARLNNILAIQTGAGILGSIAGLIYAHRTGGKWYRYLGYWVLGGLIVGVPTAMITTPFKNKIIKETATV